MPDERHTFETARIRLEEIAVEVRKRDTSLEKSLDLLEEGVRLANICTELVDHTDLSATVTQDVPAPAIVTESEEPAGAADASVPDDDSVAEESGAVASKDDEPVEETAGAEPEPASADDASDPAEDEASDEPAPPADSEDIVFDEMDDDLHEPAEAETAE